MRNKENKIGIGHNGSNLGIGWLINVLHILIVLSLMIMVVSGLAFSLYLLVLLILVIITFYIWECKLMLGNINDSGEVIKRINYRLANYLKNVE
jgi:hypothetical protein